MRTASSENHRKNSAAYAISAFDSASALPISSVIRRASSSVRSTSFSKARRRISPLSRGGCFDHSACASSAAASAAIASSGVASAISQSGSAVEGSSTASVSPPEASRHSPPIKSCLFTLSTTLCSEVAILIDAPFVAGFRPQSTPFGPPLGMIERPFFSSRFLGSCPATGFRWPGVGLAVTAEVFVLNPPSCFEVGHDVLYAGVVLQTVHGEVLAVARVLEAAVGHLCHEGDVGVDPDAPEVQPPADPHRPSVVLREHAGSEAVLDAVGPPYSLVFIGERLDGDDGTEDLVLGSFVFLPCSVIAATKSSWMPGWASTRVAAVQSWPALK